MGLKEQITEQMKAAMRAKETIKLKTIRFILAAIKQKEVDERIVLEDAQVLAIIEKMIKQRKDSITQFEAGGRQDLVDLEKEELFILQSYMPQSLSDTEIHSVVQATIHSCNPEKRTIGNIMAILKTKLTGQADMKTVSILVKNALK